METTLHRQLKVIYADGDAQLEAKLGSYRIDVRVGEELVEIQHGSLAAIRDKVASLVKEYRVLVVKPLVVRKRIFTQASRTGPVLRSRLSPRQGSVLDLFHELVYVTRLFPHRNLCLEVPLVDIEEYRYPGHGRRRRWRRDDYQVADQRLVQILRIHRFRTAYDLTSLLPPELPTPFHSGQLAQLADVPRWVAQRITYCLRKMGAAEEVGKQANTRLYQLARGTQRVA